MGISGATGTNSRKAWRALNARLVPGDVLVVVAVDRIGRRWMDTVSTLRNLRNRQVRVRSLAPSEQHWTCYFDANPDSPEAVIGDVLASFFTWAAQQELESVRRRTKAGLEKAKANGKTLGGAPENDRPEGGNGQILPEERAELQANRGGVGGIEDHS